MRKYLTESPPCSSGTHVESKSLIGVTPQQITDGTLAWNFLKPVQFSDIIKSFDVGGQSSVGSEDLPLYDSCQRQIVEKFGQHFPDVVVLVLPHAFIVETVVLGDASGFVVPSEQCDSGLISNFECK